MKTTRSRIWLPVLLLATTALMAILEIVVTILADRGVLGEGENEFIRFGQIGAACALLAVVTGLVAVALGVVRRLNVYYAITTLVLAVVSVALFWAVLSFGSNAVLWWRQTGAERQAPSPAKAGRGKSHSNHPLDLLCRFQCRRRSGHSPLGFRSLPFV